MYKKIIILQRPEVDLLPEIRGIYKCYVMLLLHSYVYATKRKKKLVDGLTLGIIENRCFQKQTVLLVDLCHMTKIWL